MSINAKLIGAGHALAQNIVTSEDLETQMEFDKYGIRKGMSKLLSGVSERRFASPDENSSTFAIKAGKMALENANVAPEDVDILIFAAITQDFAEPATANVIQHELKLVNAKCFDVKNACNAFLSSIEIANMYIKQGAAKTILIVSGEVLSRYVRMHYDDPKEINEANSTFAVGDGGGALLFQAYESDDEGVLTKFETHGQYWEDGVLWGGGTMYPHDPEKFYLQNETREMLKLNFERAMDFYKNTMQEMNINIDDVELFVPSQITKYLIIKTTEILGLPKDNVVSQIEKFGNTGAASIPIGISRAIQNGTLKLGSNQKVVCMGAANGFNMGLVDMNI